MASRSLDLLEHFRQDVVITPECTTHVEFRHDRARGVRKEKIEKQWYRKQRIGLGSFGDVWLEATSKECRTKSEGVLVDFIGWYEDVSHVFFSMEYFELGDLSHHIAESITESDVKAITTDILNGLRIIHDENFAHRDLKPGNIFVVQKPPGSKWWVKIGDFGISKRVEGHETAFRTQFGTPHYQAPEITGYFDTGEQTYEKTVDMWSLGCVIYEIATQNVPFPDSRAIIKFCGKRLPFPEQALLVKLSREGVKFVKRLIVPNPRERLSVTGALQVAWLSHDQQGAAVMQIREPAKSDARMLSQTAEFQYGGGGIGSSGFHNPPCQQSTSNSSLPTVDQTDFWGTGNPNQTKFSYYDGTNYDKGANHPYMGSLLGGTRLKGTLDRQYRKREPRFFVPGVVFITLWSENVGSVPTPRAIDYGYTPTKVDGEYVHTRIQRFVVISQKDSYVICVPIVTYAGQATNKKGINRESHAVIYTSDEPCLVPGEQKLIKRPIKVRAVGGVLCDASRVNFAKMYTVECNIKVALIGYVDSAAVPYLKMYSREALECE